MPDLVIVDGAPGLDAALAALWSDVAVQRCTVHKLRNRLARRDDFDAIHGTVTIPRHSPSVRN